VASATAIALRLGGQQHGHNWRMDCPRGCGYELSLSDGEDGKLLAHCFGGCEFETILPALVPHGLLDDDDDAMCHDVSLSVRPSRSGDFARSRAACRIYDRLAPAIGTIAETYLRSRHITIATPSVLRFGDCPHRIGSSFPAMVAPVANIDGDQIGIHATYLHPTGSGKADFADKKLQRECRGVIRGGAIRLAPFDPDRELIVAEGVETTLSAMQIFGLPGWSAVFAGGLMTVELPPAARRIVIAADNDASGTGQRNAVTAFDRWSTEGRTVRIKSPAEIGTDFNDVLVRGRR
jgi:hypothetical protein